VPLGDEGEEGEEGELVVVLLLETLPHPERKKRKALAANRSFTKTRGIPAASTTRCNRKEQTEDRIVHPVRSTLGVPPRNQAEKIRADPDTWNCPCLILRQNSREEKAGLEYSRQRTLTLY
jgi:hypothetical protein